MNLDYTNIAGSPLQDYVATQIEKRKNLVDNSYRSSSEINWLSNKNVWIRISSGTNVLKNNKNYDGLEGDELSKKYILQGGLLNHLGGDNSYELRYGIKKDGAYGIGGNDFGQVPMPGLIDISIKTGGKLGSLKETTFNFVCYNMKQLNIMEALYMKLGFGILVEWGHTSYIDNSSGIVKENIIPLPFYGIHSKEALMESITKKRVEYSGNYDATWGTVKNFSYSLEGNGRFNCQVQLVGAGDILESLKINTSGNLKTSGSSDSALAGSPYPVVADSNLSLLNNALYRLYTEDVLYNSNVDNYKIQLSSDTTSRYAQWLDSIYGKSINTTDFQKNPELVRKGFNFRLINTPGMNSPHSTNIDSNVPEISPESFFSKLIVGYEVDSSPLNQNDAASPGLEQAYITLGNLLLLIKYTGMLKQNNLADKAFKPLNYIDVNPHTNRCYTFPGHCSLDPSICLIGSEVLPFQIKSTFFDDLKTKFPFWSDDGLGGKFMYTLVNINWITTILKNFRSNSTKGEVMFVDFVDEVLKGISKATGGYNEFRIFPDDDTSCIRIFDDRKTVGSGITAPKYTEIPVLGKTSIAYDFSYKTKIAPNTAKMIVVAAQAQPYGVQGAENALAFSHLNKGLENRLGTVTIDAANEANLENAEKPNDDTIARYVELRGHLEGIYNGGQGVPAFTPEEVKTEQENIETANKVEENEKTGEKYIPGGALNAKDMKTLVIGAITSIFEELKKIAQTGKDEDGKPLVQKEKEVEVLTVAYTALTKEIKAVPDKDFPKSEFAVLTFYIHNGMVDNKGNKLPDGQIIYKDVDLYGRCSSLLPTYYKKERDRDDDKYDYIDVNWTGIKVTDTDIEEAWEKYYDKTYAIYNQGQQF